MVPNEEVKTQVNIFLEHRDEDAEELSHRYDNIRIELEYPFTALELLVKSVAKWYSNATETSTACVCACVRARVRACVCVY